MRPSARAIVAAAALATLPVWLLAYREGPLAAMTGGFGEPTCHSCHFDLRLNDKSGTLAIDGVPPEYIAAREYPIRVTLKRAGLARAGFEMSARFAQAPMKGQQAGRFRTEGDRLQVVFAPQSPVEYIQHTKTGSLAAPLGEAVWTLTWRAPDRIAGDVQINVAANASNDDQSPLGDFIYTSRRTIRASR